MLHYGRQSITESDIQKVAAALREALITTGPIAAEFESEFARYVGAKHAVVVCNATAALHLAMRVAGIGPGDRVMTSANTFLASANCAAFVGATPDFADIDSRTFNLCPQSMSDNWRPDIKAVIPVHYAGGSADMQSIAELARKRGAIIIEDACHAVGGSIEHDGTIKKIGGHEWADITTFSFHPVKTMTTGEGGMLVTDNDEYAANARLLRTHGMTRDEDTFVGLGDADLNATGPWYYEMQHLGYNYRITDFQCALGISQLSRLDQAIARRRKIVADYNAAFSNCKFLTTPRLKNENEREYTSWHLYSLQINFESLGKSRVEIMQSLRLRGIGTHVLYIPVYLQPWYRKTYGYAPGKCPRAETFYQRALCLPLFPSMTEDDVTLVINGILELVD